MSLLENNNFNESIAQRPSFQAEESSFINIHNNSKRESSAFAQLFNNQDNEFQPLFPKSSTRSISKKTSCTQDSICTFGFKQSIDPPNILYPLFNNKFDDCNNNNKSSSDQILIMKDVANMSRELENRMEKLMNQQKIQLQFDDSHISKAESTSFLISMPTEQSQKNLYFQQKYGAFFKIIQEPERKKNLSSQKENINIKKTKDIKSTSAEKKDNRQQSQKNLQSNYVKVLNQILPSKSHTKNKSQIISSSVHKQKTESTHQIKKQDQMCLNSTNLNLKSKTVITSVCEYCCEYTKIFSKLDSDNDGKISVKQMDLSKLEVSELLKIIKILEQMENLKVSLSLVQFIKLKQQLY